MDTHVYKIKGTDIKVYLTMAEIDFNISVNGTINTNFMQDFMNLDCNLIQGYSISDLEYIN